MKKSIVLIIVALMSLTSFAQTKPLIKKIEVTGSAEIEIIPDEIWLRIALKEYKDGGKIINLDKLEAELVRSVRSVGLSEADLKVENVYGYNWNWRKKKSDDFLATKSYKLKMADVKKLNNLLEKLDVEGVNSVNIIDHSHSQIEKYRKELKIKALQAAKVKATYLVTAIGEELGGALEITEFDHGNNYPVRSMSNMMMKEESMDSGYQSDLDFQTIKLRFEIRAVFEIK